MDLKNFLTKDRIGAALLLILGVAVVATGRSYNVGTLTRMGPGYIPTALGIVLLLVGSVLLIFSRSGEADQTPEMPDLRGGAFILAAVFGFQWLGEYGGLVPATFASVFIAAMGDRKNSVRDAALLGSAITAVAVLIFHWAIGMQFPLFQWGA